MTEKAAEANTMLPDTPNIAANGELIPLQHMSKAMVEGRISEALREYYDASNANLGPKAAKVVSFLAEYLKRFEASNQDVSKILQGTWNEEQHQPIGMVGRVEDVGVKVPRGTTIIDPEQKDDKGKPVKVEGYFFTKAHPNKQHGRLWKQCAQWEAMLPQNVGKPNGDPPLSEWPVHVMVNGTEYASPVGALAAGHGLVRVHIAWSNALRPTIYKLDTVDPNTINGQMAAGFRLGTRMKVVVRAKQISVGQSKQIKKSVKLDEVPHAAYAAIGGILLRFFKGNDKHGEVALQGDQKQALIALLQDGTIPEDLVKLQLALSPSKDGKDDDDKDDSK